MLFAYIFNYLCSLLTVLCITVNAYGSINKCNELLQKHIVENYELKSVLDQNHPAIVAILKNLKKISIKKNKIQIIDALKFQAFVNDINDSLPGKFQINPYNGMFHLMYIEQGKFYYLDIQVRDNKVVISERVPTSPEYMSSFDPSNLEKRFRRPDGMSLIGFERAYDGLIIPIFSESNSLTEFRDMRSYQADVFSGFDPKVAGAAKRIAMEVPLYPIKIKSILKTDKLNIDILPDELKNLILSNHTLTTVPSLRSIAPKFQSPDIYPDYQNYTALIIGDNSGQGRTGVLMKNGIPILVRIKAKEYFIEIKGVGLASQAYIEEMIHPRMTFSTRLGRANHEQVIREFEGYNVISTLDQNNERLSRPIIGLELPEYSAREQIFEGVVTTRSAQFSGQIFRLAASTRRLAYSDNSAFGKRYSQRPILLKKAQEYYGKIIARLRVQPVSNAFIHNSPHPQNFIYFPLTDDFVITDFSDIHQVEPRAYLRFKLPDIDQYLIFKDRSSRLAFLNGVKAELNKQGLWSAALEELESVKFSTEELTDHLVKELLVLFILKSNDPNLIREKLLPHVDKPNFHLLEIIHQDTHALANQGQYLEIAFRHYLRELRHIEKGLILIENSKSTEENFIEFQSQIQKARSTLTQIIDQVSQFYKSEKLLKMPWSKNLMTYVRIMSAYRKNEAEAYDLLTIYRDPALPLNVEIVENDELSKYILEHVSN